MEVNIEPGYIILRHTKGWAPTAWGIRKLTGSYWNHVGGVVIEEGNKVKVIEADPPVVKKTPVAEYVDPKKFDIKIVALREDAFKDQTEYDTAVVHSTIFLQSKIGFKYDTKAIFWLALRYTVLSWFRHPKDNPLQDREKFFCSELICNAWHGTSSIIEHLFAGVKHPEAECCTITPKDIGKTVNVKYIAGKNVI
jgi:hypothetical protein